MPILDGLIGLTVLLFIVGGIFTGIGMLVGESATIIGALFDRLPPCPYWPEQEQPIPPKRDAYGFIVQESKEPKYHFIAKNQHSR